MPTPRAKSGLLHHEDGRVEADRFYYGEHEENPPGRARLDPNHYATWIEDDGGTSVSVGASPTYSANYGNVD